MALYDAQLNNTSDRNVRQYKDLDLFFGRKSSNNDVGTVTDIQAVKRSIRNLVLLNAFEKPFHPELSSGIRGMLFELMSPVTAATLTKQIENVIANYEPRALVRTIRSIPNVDNNAYDVQIEFYVINAPTELVELTVMLERLR